MPVDTYPPDFKIFHQVNQIKRWFSKAVPEPTSQNVHVQIGVHLEEVTEMLAALRDAGNSFKMRETLAFAVDVLEYTQRKIKSNKGDSQIALTDLDRVELLDALCDQIVTSIGVAHMLGMDIESALQEVADSNDSKFDENGEPIFNDQRKIVKGSSYFPPDLTRFV